jgi:hypothetical protein
MLFLSSSQAAIAAARNIVSALNNPTTASPICSLATSQRAQLHQLADISTQHTANTPPQQSDEPTPSSPIDKQQPTPSSPIDKQQTPLPPHSHHIIEQQDTTSDGATPTS